MATSGGCEILCEELKEAFKFRFLKIIQGLELIRTSRCGTNLNKFCEERSGLPSTDAENLGT